MPQTQYAQGNPLAALLQGIMQGQGGAMVPSAPSAPAAAPSGDFNSQIMAAMNAASALEPVIDQPVPNAPKTWQKVLGAIADAASVYASGRNPFIHPINTTGYLMGQEQASKDIPVQNAQRRADAESKSKRQRAEMELRSLIGQQEGMSADATARFKADRETQQAREKQAGEIDLENLKAQHAMDREELIQKGLTARERIKQQFDAGSKFAGKQIEAMNEGYQTVNDIAEGIPKDDKAGTPAMSLMEALKSGKITPSEIRTKFRRFLVPLSLHDDGASAVTAYFAQEVEPILQAYEYEQKVAELNAANDAVLKRQKANENAAKFTPYSQRGR